ncbi:MAG: hypothetical protein N4A31_02275 [Rickettsiales bacterium]|jgi:lipopolysaccharide transport protein LptA|nr:hypothetical protein [Rickettsiales bacterium]
MPNKTNSRYKIIKLIKYFCVIVAAVTVVVISYYVFVNKDNKIRQDNSIQVQPSDKEEINSRVNNPDLVGLSFTNGPYYIKAEQMNEFSDYASFVSPKVELMLNHIDWLNVASNTAKLTKSDNHLQLFDNVKANFNKFYYYNGNQAEILKDESIIRSDSYSKLFTDEYNLESDNGFILNYQNETIFFYGKINANFKQVKDESITNIKSDKFDVFWSKKTGHFLGDVILTKNGTVVEADKMIVILNPKTDKLDKVRAYGKVRITDKDIIATGEYGEYLVATEILTLKDHVKLYKDNNILSGELLHYNFATKKADLVGAPKISKNRVSAVIIPEKKHD